MIQLQSNVAIILWEPEKEMIKSYFSLKSKTLLTAKL